MDFSFVIPVYNEEDSIPVLFGEIKSVMDRMGGVYEVIFVDDGSNDVTPQIFNKFENEFPHIVRVVSLSKRSGQTFALRQGLNAASGSMIVTLDADLQNDPADISTMVKKLKDKGLDCVCGWRKSRQDTSLKAGLSKLGNILQRIFTGLEIHDVSCTLRVYRRQCVGKIALNWEGQHRFIPLSLSLQGYKIGEVVSNHRLRKFGATKYSHKRIFRVIVDFFKILITGGKK